MKVTYFYLEDKRNLSLLFNGVSTFAGYLMPKPAL